MKTKIQLFLLILVCATLNGQTNPFDNSPSTWIELIKAENPYTFEVAFAETTKDLNSKIGSSDDSNNRVLNSGFLNTAKITKIAVSEDQAGIIEREDGFRIVYKIIKTGDFFKVFISVDAKSNGKRSITPEVSIQESKRSFATVVLIKESGWSVIGGLEIPEFEITGANKKSPKLSYSIALKIQNH